MIESYDFGSFLQITTVRGYPANASKVLPRITRGRAPAVRRTSRRRYRPSIVANLLAFLGFAFLTISATFVVTFRIACIVKTANESEENFGVREMAVLGKISYYGGQQRIRSFEFQILNEASTACFFTTADLRASRFCVSQKVSYLSAEISQSGHRIFMDHSFEILWNLQV